MTTETIKQRIAEIEKSQQERTGRTKFIELPSGDSLHPETIRAIRLGDPRPTSDVYVTELKPRVIIDYLVGKIGNSIVVNCETIEDRNDLATYLKAQISGH